MNKEWVLAMKAEQEKSIEKSVSELKTLISELPCYTDDVKQKLYSIVDSWRGNYRASAHDLLLEMITSAKPHMDIFGFARDHDIYSMCNFISNPGNLERYLDSEPVEFDGDIIITDPCYIVKHDDKDTDEDDWDRCDYGYSMEELGISHYMARNTMYGDWGCTLFNSDTEEPIGEFCADAGMVAVFLLDEVLKYNPEFDYHINRPWTTALVKNFKGTIQFVVTEETGEYENDSEWHKKGDKWRDYQVQVVGHGIDKTTGKPLNFVSIQTGL